MGFLCPFTLGGVLTGLGTQVLRTIHLLHTFTGGGDRLLRQVNGVRPHVANVALFIKALSHSHGIAGGEAQLPVGFLLQCRSGKRRRRLAGNGLLF